MGRLVTSPGILKNVQGQIDHVTDMYDDIKDNNLKPLTITLTSVANANGAISVVTNDDRITEDMKAIDIEVGTPESFKAPVTITTGAGTVTLTCTNASGNSTVKATFIKTSPVEGGEDYPPAVTSTEFDILADRIGSLATLETTDKSDLVSAVNEVVGDVDTLSNNLRDYLIVREKSVNSFSVGAGSTVVTNAEGATYGNYSPDGVTGYKHIFSLANCRQDQVSVSLRDFPTSWNITVHNFYSSAQTIDIILKHYYIRDI